MPPKPGTIPSLISGWPKTAASAAIRTSQAIASSQPPPKAIELTAAIVATLSVPNSRSSAWAVCSSSSPPPSSICVKALMSAPAEKTTGTEEAIDHRADLIGGLDLLPDRAQVADHVGRDRVHRQVGEPGDRDVAAGLQLDRLRLLALVGLRVGVEALAGFEAEAALGDEPLQGDRRREALAVLLLELLDPLEDRVEPLQVGFPEGREEAFARVEAGAGHHPQVDVADRADALLDQLGRPRSAPGR